MNGMFGIELIRIKMSAFQASSIQRTINPTALLSANDVGLSGLSINKNYDKK